MLGFWWDKNYRQLHLPQNIIMTILLWLIALICELIRLILLPIKFVGFKTYAAVFITDNLLFVYNHFCRHLEQAWLYSIAIYVGFVLCVLLLKFIRGRICKLESRISHMLSCSLFRTIYIKPGLLCRIKKKKEKEVEKNA